MAIVKKGYTERKGFNGEIERIMIDYEDDRKVTVVETIETNESKIRKKNLNTLEDVRELLLDLLK